MTFTVFPVMFCYRAEHQSEMTWKDTRMLMRAAYDIITGTYYM